MRNHRPGSVSDAVARAVDAFGGPHREVAEFLGIRPSTLSYGMEASEDRPGGLGVAHLHRLGAQNGECAAPIAQHFAALAGGVFQPVTAGDVVPLYGHASTIAKECGEAAAALIRAAHSQGRGDLDTADREMSEAIDALVRGRADLRRQRGVA